MGLKTASNALQGNVKNPGPGTYTPVKVTDVSSSYSMGAKTRAPMSMIVNPETGNHIKHAISNDNTPAPDTYNPVKQAKNLKAGNVFGRQKRESLGNPNGAKMPAPNNYNQDQKFATVRSSPAFGFGSSKRPQTGQPKVMSPGPGTYTLGSIVGKETQGKTLSSRYPASQKRL